MAFVVAQGYEPPKKKPPIIPPQEEYTAARDTQAEDYDRLMGQYTDLAQPRSFTPLTFNPVQAATATYNPSPGFTDALGQAKTLSTTGGYSGDDKANIRARGIAPIRSVFDSARRGVERNKTLQGGYSPNYNASMAKMAREQSSILSDKTTDVEGMIAESVARNKMQASSQYSGLAAREAEMKQQIDMTNMNALNQVNQMNSMMPMNVANANAGIEGNIFNQRLGATEGARALYGTTPALTNLFGNQVTQSEQLKNQRKGNASNQSDSAMRLAMSLIPAFGRNG